MPKHATETLTPAEAERARELVSSLGIAEASRAMRVDRRTLALAIAMLRVSSLSAYTIRYSLSSRI